MPINLVLEGGGVKGIALAGAIAAMEDSQSHDFRIQRIVGTSAGSIAAALFGAGYSAREMMSIMAGPDMAQFADGSWIRKLPVVGPGLNAAYGIALRLGMFKGDYFYKLIRAKLLDRGIRTFGDLVAKGHAGDPDPRTKYTVHLIASDITRGRMLVLPDDITVDRYGINPDELEVALAVRMSISVPFVFRPVKLESRTGAKFFVVDGGLLSNFPVSFFDGPGFDGPDISDFSTKREAPPLTVGIRIIQRRFHSIGFPFFAPRAAYALVSSAIEAHDARSVERSDRAKHLRTIDVNTETASVLNFELSPLQKEQLWMAGYSTMERHINYGLFTQAQRAQRQANKAQEELK